MGTVHNLMEVTQAFEALCKSLKEGELDKGANVRLFNDVNLSLSQAMVMAWLMNHKDDTYSTRQMAAELRMEESRLNKIIDDLFEYGFLERHGEDIDIIEHVCFRIIDFEAARESRDDIKNWRDFMPDECSYYQWEEDEEKDDETPHIIGSPDFLSGINLEDEDALESMEDFDPLEGMFDDEDDEVEGEDPDDYDD